MIVTARIPIRFFRPSSTFQKDPNSDLQPLRCAPARYSDLKADCSSTGDDWLSTVLTTAVLLIGDVIEHTPDQAEQDTRRQRPIRAERITKPKATVPAIIAPN